MTRISWLLPSALVVSTLPATLALENNFSLYPPAAQSCLYRAANQSQCTGSDAQQLNSCLCSNQGFFVTSSAECIGSTDRDDVTAVYSIMSQSCNDSNTPLAISEGSFREAAAKAAASTSTSSSPSSTASATNAPPTSSGLSTGVIAGIAAGGAAVGLAALGAAIFLVRRRRRRDEESHPMLLSTDGPTTYPPHDPSSELGHRLSMEHKSSPAAGAPSPSLYSTSPHKTDRSSGMESHHHFEPYRPAEVFAELPATTTAAAADGTRNDQKTPLFEMDGSGLSGSSLHR